MMSISMAWTAKAFLAGKKDMTRRYWQEHHAKKFHRSMLVTALDKNFRIGGKPIGTLQLTKDPYQQRTGGMIEMDYKREGLLWMEENNLTVNGQNARKFFEAWKEKDDLVWVIEFQKR